ncbi:PQQ-binding-like beta-propeller repeat protein [Schlesneria paludicola]|uniref:PQQ-binding-like beta-propeller repeat protein n=1 Tax=Schlesneria paludicola TaxID=360056 RepID=UPI001ED93FFF|nr:PQQ-binding-like beta-propeller repeat protein [Schlesneria paludicola]
MLLVLSVAWASTASADDWPQWMGPHRDNVWRETGLLETLPASPKYLWRIPVAGGYSGPAVANGKVYVTDFMTNENVKTDNFDRKQATGTERILCLDETTGKELWSQKWPETYGISYPAGPRSTPLVHGDQVYVQGAEGFLACLKTQSGDYVWKKNLKDVYKTKSALWGYASQPLIDGKKLIVIAGGEGSHCVALNKDTGEEIWRTGTATEQGYSPPLLIEQAAVRQLILCSPDAIYSVDPETGKPLWSQAYQADNGSIIMTPIRSKNYLFAGGFNNRNILIEMATDKPEAKTLWRDQAKRGLSSINVQPFLMDGLIYGFDQAGDLRCFELPSGQALWSTPKPLGDRKVGSGTVFLVRAGETDRFWMFAETGDLILGQLSPKAFTELSRMHVLEPTNTAFGRDVVWCAPAFANRKMFVRNDREIVCVDLAK